MSNETITVRGRVTDLWRDPDGGWSENGCWAREVELTFASGTSRLAIARRIKKELGIVGMPTDDWCGADWSWRSGCVGASADFYC